MLNSYHGRGNVAQLLEFFDHLQFQILQTPLCLNFTFFIITNHDDIDINPSIALSFFSNTLNRSVHFLIIIYPNNKTNFPFINGQIRYYFLKRSKFTNIRSITNLKTFLKLRFIHPTCYIEVTIKYISNLTIFVFVRNRYLTSIYVNCRDEVEKGRIYCYSKLEKLSYCACIYWIVLHAF